MVAYIDFRNTCREESSVKVIGSAKQNKDINVLYAVISHPSKVITQATGRVMGLNLTGILKSCKDFALGNAKKGCVSKKTVEHSKIMGERLFFNISSPLTPPFCDKSLAAIF